MSEEPIAQLAYESKSGAWTCRYFRATNERIERELRSVRRPARLTLDGRLIGEVLWCDRPDHEGHHRKGGHWMWYFETQEAMT